VLIRSSNFVPGSIFHAGAREILGTKLLENVVNLYALETTVKTGNLNNSSHRLLPFLEKLREFSAASLVDNGFQL